MLRTLPNRPIKKKIAEAAPVEEISKPSEQPKQPQEKLPDSLEASLEAQAEELAASFPVTDAVSEPGTVKRGEAELARHRASQEEINRLVQQLPEGVRDQMDELFRARYTRIQKLDIVKDKDS